MTGRDLSDALEDAGDCFPVGAPPLEAITGQARRARRRRGTGALLGVAAMIAGAIAVPVVLTDDAPSAPPTTAPAPAASAVPAGYRVAGINHAFIEVPTSWGTNQTRCGNPEADTVIIDVGAVLTCAWANPRTPDSVTLDNGVPGYSQAPGPDQDITIDGVPARRGPTFCSDPVVDRRMAFQVPSRCTAAVLVPSENAYFEAVSATEAGVKAILDRIRVLPDQVAVPGFQTIALEAQEESAARYRQALEAAGLVAETKTVRRPGLKPGYLLEISPGPGTALAAGDTVTLTEVAAPTGPQDEVEYYVNNDSPSNNKAGIDSLSNLQLEKDPTITVRVGHRVWSYAYGKRSRTYAVELTGDALRQAGPGGPTYPNEWVATRRGTATLTLTIEVDGKPLRLSTVTVRVQ